MFRSEAFRRALCRTCRVGLITVVHSSFSEFWNEFISELTISCAVTCDSIGFPWLPVLLNVTDLMDFKVKRAVPYFVSDAGCSGNACG